MCLKFKYVYWKTSCEQIRYRSLQVYEQGKNVRYVEKIYYSHSCCLSYELKELQDYAVFVERNVNTYFSSEGKY